jgi:hypothetical protein
MAVGVVGFGNRLKVIWSLLSCAEATPVTASAAAATSNPLNDAASGFAAPELLAAIVVHFFLSPYFST